MYEVICSFGKWKEGQLERVIKWIGEGVSSRSQLGRHLEGQNR